MNKKQILAMGLSAALLCTGSAFAIEAETTKVENTKPIQQEGSEQGTEAQEAQLVRVGEMASVTSVQKEADMISSMLVKTEAGQEIQLNLDMHTMVVNNKTGVPATLGEIKAGDKVFVYYSPAMTRSLPPQAACELILVNVGDKIPASLHEVGTVTKEEDGKYAIATQAGDMIIRADSKTAISDARTKNVIKAEDLTKGTRFLAWYDMVAMSYPGQAYTEKIVVLPAVPATVEIIDTETVSKTEVAPETMIEKAKSDESELKVAAYVTKAEMKDGKAVIAVRKAAEVLGCKVSYEQKDGKEFVTIENDTRKMTLEIGQDLYVSASSKEGMVGMTAPEKYGVAPYIADGVTYAPADMFKALVGFDVEVKDGTVTISAKK